MSVKDYPFRPIQGTFWPGTLALTLILLGCGMPLASRGASAAPTVPPPETGNSDLLQFLDGGMLHGHLKGMDSAVGVTWEHPAAKNVITFKPANIAWIRFEKSQRVQAASKSTCWLQFTNGDEVFGNLKSLDSENIELETWFGGALQAPRSALASASFNWNGFSVLYEGPNGPDGWNFDRGPRGWKYRDGGFVANSVGILGRDLGLNVSSSLAFDLSWNGHFSLSIILYTDAIDRYDYSQNSYMIHLAPGYINLQRVQAGSGVTTLGPQAQIPGMNEKNQTRLDIRCNKADATFYILADGQLVHQWKDHSGFVARGSGVVFSAQMDGPSVRLSNIKATEWDGTLEPQVSTNNPPDLDVVYLANRDRVLGEVKSLSDGKLSVSIPKTTIAIPLERVTHFALTKPKRTDVEDKPWEIRAEVSGGGSVAFHLDGWSDDKVSGTSSNFGRVALNPKSIRQVQFNRHKPSVAADSPSFPDDEFSHLDE